ncbi:RAMP superfamily CRISPR-associated protein [Actinomadura geliboluensis]|uniref:RAMP superfamily CRISPR-associated protein n=1 Tax=Actinomadura geliboluensis TaxID=882440 RepID=UPI0026244F2F|nr:RAMP superfamily CRISPR-associated protein [Actinomadura geliboluensis]
MTRRGGGRPLDRRLRVRGWLRTQTPLHVGGVALDPAEALPVAVDGQDRVYVPGTSLAGVLRAWMRGADPQTALLDDMWGFEKDGKADSGQASRVVVRDAVVTTTTGTDSDGIPNEPLRSRALPVLHGVGIDRVTGSAASAFLYARTVVPPGHYLSFEVDVETTTARVARDRARLHALLTALKSEEIGIGAATGKGLGVVTLMPTPLDVHEHDFTSREGLLAFLSGEPARFDEAAVDAAAADLPGRRERLTVQLRWRPDAPVMVRAAGEGALIKTLPLTTETGTDTVRLKLTGSSLKGAFRSHAELIERTARGLDAPQPPIRDATDDAGDDASARRHAEAFLKQLDGLDAVRMLFGAARRAEGDTPSAYPWGSGALTVHDCVSETAIPSDVWDIVLNGPPDEGAGAGLPTVPPSVRDALAARGLDQADHVAIDRWTGGAADQLLFSVLEPHGVVWEPIRLSVDLTRLGHHRDVALALLLLVLRDLEQRRLPLGAMVNRGFGDVTIESIEFSGNGWTAETTFADALRHGDLATAWREYVGGMQ